MFTSPASLVSLAGDQTATLRLAGQSATNRAVAEEGSHKQNMNNSGRAQPWLCYNDFLTKKGAQSAHGQTNLTVFYWTELLFHDHSRYLFHATPSILYAIHFCRQLALWTNGRFFWRTAASILTRHDWDSNNLKSLRSLNGIPVSWAEAGMWNSHVLSMSLS